MKTLSLALITAVLLAPGPSSRAGLPQSIESAPCAVAPVIDGVLGAEEWKAAPALKFDLALIRFNPNATETRPCELRVMNSANALYVAFRVEDKTVDDSLSPLVIDSAILAFCTGTQLVAGDDRKAIGGPAYRDKHWNGPGKGDTDDARQDGRAASGREPGMCVFEWAVPLDSGDKEDLRAKPGDSVRFNLAYFDAFQVPLTKTVMGGLYGSLDRADAWGTLRLASNVKNDGGSAFRGPTWLKPLFEGLTRGPAARLRFVDAPAGSGTGPTTAKALVSFTYRDEHGAEQEGKAKLYLPESVHADGNAKHPLFFASGYELADGMEAHYTQRGWIVASPRALGTNPLIRTVNPDSALLHMVRALPFVDDTRVLVGGGSAGGYMTLLQAAETFPLAGAIPDVPPVNWGYNAAYCFKQLDKAGPQGGKTPKLPFFFTVATLLKASPEVYGEDYDDATWFAHSPIAHVPTITCPVSVYWSTADMLVPINQVGARWVQPFDPAQFPAGFTMDPNELMKSHDGRLSLLDVLPPGDFEIFTQAVPPGTSKAGAAGKSAAFELPTSVDKLWSIGIVDEGPPEPALGHRKFNLNLTRAGFLERVVTGKVPARQLTLIKLERLMDRYAGKEWLPSRLKHLDFPESERSDVLRGLRTYVSADPENARTFTALYAQLPPARQVLGPKELKELQEAKASR